MPSFRLPFSEIPKKEILPKGDYPGMVEKVVKARNSQDTGDNLVWDLQVLDPRFEGETLRMWTGLSVNSLWKLESIMVNLGKAEEGKDLEIDIDDETGEVFELAGLPCVIAVSVGKDISGKRDQNNVDDLFGPSGRPVKAAASSSNGNGSGPGRRPRAR